MQRTRQGLKTELGEQIFLGVRVSNAVSTSAAGIYDRGSDAPQKIAVHNPTVLGPGVCAGLDNLGTDSIKRAVDQDLMFGPKISPPPDVKSLGFKVLE